MKNIIFRCGDYVDIAQFDDNWGWTDIMDKYTEWINDVTNGDAFYREATDEEIEKFDITAKYVEEV